MSRRKDNRPELIEALSLCRIVHATLIIAGLDRLSRNVGMIARLIERALEFLAADFRHANPFTIHILATVAEHESHLNWERMKEAIAARRERGPDWTAGLQRHPAVSSRLSIGVATPDRTQIVELKPSRV